MKILNNFEQMSCKFLFLITFIIFLSIRSSAQEELKDSARSLSEVKVTTFERKVQTVGGTRSVIKELPILMQNKTTLLQLINTAPGVRMEERSPGSYRINIRGSSLRSPFGIRNVKVYWNDIPFTDPGGNTYFNQFTALNLTSINIYRGPASSLYGQGTGGVIIMDNKMAGANFTGAEYSAGSYNYHSVSAKARFGSDSAGKNLITYTHNQGDGYREQIKMHRDNFSWISEMAINKKHSLNFSVLYTDMYYQTPGGLTLAEFQKNPRASRPAVGKFPSAKDVNAAIWQRTFTAGVTYNQSFSNSLSQKTTIYGAFARVKNSAIRNFERRNEPHFGARTMFAYNKKFGQDLENSFNWDNGFEFQQGYFNTQVFSNKKGTPDTIQTNDDINSTVYNFISQATLSLNSKWVLIAGVSINKNTLRFTRLSDYPVREQTFNFKNELAPRFAVLRRFEKNWQLAVNISKGFSPPTIAELLPSTGTITPLNAEHGWNYEMIFRKYNLPGNIDLDVSTYYFKLTDALAQRRDEAGADYFVNAGAVDQKGVEASLRNALYFNSVFFNSIQNQIGYTLSFYKYNSFIKGTENFSGKTVPGVPKHTIAYNTRIYSNLGFQFDINYYFASKIFLNDANAQAADPYHLLGIRIGWRKDLNPKISAIIYTGADNLLNQVYSLGNDINAAGGRYYNVAPGRNYYAGIAFELKKSKTGIL